MCCTFIPLFPVREGWRAECWRPTGLMKEVRLLQLGCSLASQGSREPQACCQIRLDTTSMLIMWLSVLWVFKLLIYLAKYTVISPFLSKGQLRHRPVIVSKQSRDLKPQYNLTSRRSFKKTHNNYFCLCWVFIIAQGLSLVAESRGYSLVAVRGLLTAVASWGAVAQELWRPGLVAPWHAVRCSQIKPVAPALAGSFLTMKPPGKTRKHSL